MLLLKSYLKHTNLENGMDLINLVNKLEYHRIDYCIHFKRKLIFSQINLIIL